jgi:hypothetical protein
MFDSPREVDSSGLINYKKIKVGNKTLADHATLNLGSLKDCEYNWKNKKIILEALAENNIKALREISKYFYRVSGIY